MFYQVRFKTFIKGWYELTNVSQEFVKTNLRSRIKVRHFGLHY